jgi:hypothetical protein
MKLRERQTLQKLYKNFTIVNSFVRSDKNLDGIETLEYDVLTEKQGIKNSLRIFLQGTEAILPDQWETLFGLEGDYTRAFSPCKLDAYNALDSAEYYTRLDSELSPGVFPIHTLLRYGLEDVRFFCFLAQTHRSSSRMNSNVKPTALSDILLLTQLVNNSDMNNTTSWFYCQIFCVKQEVTRW